MPVHVNRQAPTPPPILSVAIDTHGPRVPPRLGPDPVGRLIVRQSGAVTLGSAALNPDECAGMNAFSAWFSPGELVDFARAVLDMFAEQGTF